MPNLVTDRLAERGLSIPPAQVLPPGVQLSYRRLVRDGDILYVAGHGPTLGDGWGCLGKVGQDVSLAEAVQAAQLTALNVLGTIQREVGSIDSLHWLKVNGYVNAIPGFTDQALVVNGFTDLILDLFGPDHLGARTSIGVPDLPFGMPVEVDAIVRCV